jgi:hypothetical protein
MNPFSFSIVQSKTELIKLLISQANEYSFFILERLNRQSDFIFSESTELHHIIPRYMDGPDESWNLIRLTFQEHTEAHFLLYTVWRNPQDLAVYHMRKGQTGIAQSILRKLNVEKMRRESKKRFNSELQREIGKKTEVFYANLMCEVLL